MPTLLKVTTILVSIFVTLLIQAVNMIFTFTFGMEVIGGFLLGSIIGEQAASILSGLVCVLLFDGAWMTGLFVFIFVARGWWQRGAVAIQTTICFLLSLGASIVAFIILTPIADNLPDILQLAMSGGGTILVIGSFVVNALAAVFMIIFHPAVGEILQQAGRDSIEIEFKTKVDNELDRQTFSQAAQQVMEIVPPIAAWKAAQWRNDFLNRLGIGGTELMPPPVPPTIIPGQAHYVDRNGNRTPLQAHQPLHQSGNGRNHPPIEADELTSPAGPATFAIYRTIPGNAPRLLDAQFAQFADAESYIQDHTHNDPPQTRYAIKANGQTHATYERTDREVQTVDIFSHDERETAHPLQTRPNGQSET